MVGECASDHGPGSNHDVPTQFRPRQDDHTGAQPTTIANANWDVLRPLGVDDLIGIFVPMVLIGDVDVRPGVHIVADLHAKVTDDVAASADHAPVTDSYHRISDHPLPWHHPSRQADPGANEGVVADLNPPLAELGSGRERNTATSAEAAEPSRPPVLGSQGTLPGDPAPTCVSRPVEQPPACPPRVADSRRNQLGKLTAPVFIGLAGGWHPETVADCVPSWI